MSTSSVDPSSPSPEISPSAPPSPDPSLRPSPQQSPSADLELPHPSPSSSPTPTPPARRQHANSPSPDDLHSRSRDIEYESSTSLPISPIHTPQHAPPGDPSTPHVISSPLHPPSTTLPTYTLTALPSRPFHDTVVPSHHDGITSPPPPSSQDESDNTFPIIHPPVLAAPRRVRRQNSVFAPSSSSPFSLPPPPPVAYPHVPPSDLRQYHLWQGNAKFFCDGRLMTGPGWEKAAVSFFLILIPAVLFLVFPAVDLISRLSVSIVIIGSVLTAVSLVFLVVTSVQDPGVIPRNPVMRRPGEEEDMPMTQEIMMDGRRVHVKYCLTCHIYRPPRAVHCSLCDACVEKFDHHCPWIGTCVGKNNYRSFSIFINSTTLLLLFVLTFCIVDMVKIVNEHDPSSSLDSAFAAMLRRNPIAFLIALYCWFAAFFVIGLTVFHCYLVSSNQTTNENLKGAFEGKSPWSKGCIRNWVEMCRGKRMVEGWKRREKVYQMKEEQAEIELNLHRSPSHPTFAQSNHPPDFPVPLRSPLASPLVKSYDEQKQSPPPADVVHHSISMTSNVHMHQRPAISTLNPRVSDRGDETKSYE